MRTLNSVSFAFVIPVLVVGLAVTPVAADCGGCEAKAASSCSSKTEMACSASKDVVDVAVSAGSFKTLVTAVKAAGLVDALKGKGPFTVFAPTDEAFAKLPKGTVEGLLKDKAKLKSILLYHVVSGKVPAEKVVTLKHAKTLLGQKVEIKTGGKYVKVNNAKVLKTDIMASNGIIHVIDRVILPKADIVDTAREAGSFKTLLAAAEAAGLIDTLRGSGPYTVFAPTDDAFAKLPEGTVEALLEDKDKLRSILLYHVVPGSYTSKDVVKLDEAKTAMGQMVAFNNEDGVRVNNAQVIKADIMTGNGVVHVIDTVILPQ
jgi:uncharacterized surface protein with fasciclin (FAS1) repeats